MNTKARDSQIDLEQIRHDLANAIGTLQTAIGEIQSRLSGAEDALELHRIGMERLGQILSCLDRINDDKE